MCSRHRSLVILRREAAGLAEVANDAYHSPPSPRGEQQSGSSNSRTCAARFYAKCRACDWQDPVGRLGCIAVPSYLYSSDSSLRLASSGWLVVLLVLLICIHLIPSRLCSTTGNLTTPPVIVVVVSHDREPCGTVWGSMYPTCRVAVAGSFLLCLIR